MRTSERAGATEDRALADTDRPCPARHVRVSYDPVRERPVLLSPETVTVLNGTGAAIVELCDGSRTVADVVGALGERYAGVDGEQVRRYIAVLAARRFVTLRPGAGERG